MLPQGHRTMRREDAFGFGALRREDALRTRAADAVELRGIGQRSLLMMVVLRGDNGGCLMQRMTRHGRIVPALPVEHNRQAYGTNSRQHLYHLPEPPHFSVQR